MAFHSNHWINLSLHDWNSAASKWGYDVRNRLVADVFYDNGTEFIKFTRGKEITVETACPWERERVLEYASS